MTTHKGFGLIAVLVIVAGLLIAGGGAYLLSQGATQEGTQTKEEFAGREPEGVAADASIHWKFDDTGERDHIPYTRVSVQLGETMHDLGLFQGSCSVIDETNAGVDGKGLLAGELSAAQCWFAGGGDEIGVFAHEDGGYQIMVGTLEEPIEGGAGFRGDFKIKTDIPL